MLANTLIRLLDRPKDKQIETQLAQIYVSVFSNLTYNGILGKIIITSKQSSLYYLLDVMHSGAQLGNFERGARRYIYAGKDEIIDGPSPGVKCVSPPLETCP